MEESETLKFYTVNDEYIEYLIQLAKSFKLKTGTKYDVRKVELLYKKQEDT